MAIRVERGGAVETGGPARWAEGRVHISDPFARRISKRVTHAGETRFHRVLVSETRFVWDGDVLVHEIEKRARAGGDPIVEERTYSFEEGGFAPVAHRERRVDDVGRESGGWFHYVNDPIGTPERLCHRRPRRVPFSPTSPGTGPT